MLQELLTALNGYSGDIFIEDNNGNMKIVDELPFIAPTEQSLMNEVCILGSYYKKMHKFTQTFSNPLINKDVSGLYKVTLAHAVDDALKVYITDLMDIQKELLADEFLSVSYVKWRLNEYFVLFPVLWNILNGIINSNLRGCQILDVIYRNISMGSAKVRVVLNQILKRCNHVFYHQLSAWLLRGSLFDPYKEFFIEASFSNSTTKSDTESSDETVLIDNMTKTKLNMIFYEGVDKKRASSFAINRRNIPCFVPITLGKKILFIGESVHFFDRDRRSFIINDWSDGTELGNKLKNELSNIYSESLKTLREADEFNLLSVQELVEGVEVYVRKRMWVLLVEEHKFLEDCLGDVKDYFLLGRGELFMEFITSMEGNVIGCEINSTMETIINNEFLKASHLVLMDKDETIKKFKFVIGHKPDGSLLKWEDIHLTYDVSWPFHIVFTKEILANYDDIFRFLVMLKRTQMRLYQGCDRKKFRGMLLDKLWMTRNQMNFLFNNLQYYLQVDVIESQTSLFHSNVVANQDIESLKDLHDKLINSIKAQSFLFDRTISSGFVNLSEACIDYCNLAELHSATEIDFVQTDVSLRLTQLRDRMHASSSLLFNILSNVEEHLTSNPHLRQLLLRLDFNHYFSKAGVEMGSLKKSHQEAVKTFNV